MTPNKPENTAPARRRHPVATRVTQRELEMLDRYRANASAQRGDEPVSRSLAVRMLIRAAQTGDVK